VISRLQDMAVLLAGRTPTKEEAKLQLKLAVHISG